MRNVTIAVLLLAGASAYAEKGAAKDAGGGAGAKAIIEKIDAAFNAHDAKAFNALLDKSFVFAGPYYGSKPLEAEAARAEIERQLAAGGHLTRESTTLKTDDDGGAAWYVSEVTFIPKVPPGALAMRRRMHETGAMVRHGKEWKLTLLSLAMLTDDPAAAAAQPSGSTAAPMKK